MRVRDSVLACDATGGSDLIFVSHADVIDGRRGAAPATRARRAAQDPDHRCDARAVGRARASACARYALVAAYGRPFTLGGLRLELFPSGYGPGAASLLCEHEAGRLVYSGPVGTRARGAGRARAVPRRDLRLVALRLPRPGRRAGVGHGVRAAIASPPGGRRWCSRTPATRCWRARARSGEPGVALRAHRAALAAAATFRAAGVAVPSLARFAGKLDAGEALLWPADGARRPDRCARLTAPAFLLASGAAADPTVVGPMRASTGRSRCRPWPTSPGCFAMSTPSDRARSAVMHAGDGELCQTLRAARHRRLPRRPARADQPVLTRRSGTRVSTRARSEAAAGSPPAPVDPRAAAGPARGASHDGRRCDNPRRLGLAFPLWIELNHSTVFNLGMGEITVILLLALIVLGPKKLPELASGLGKIIRDIRKATNDVKNEIQLDDAIRKPFEELRDAVTLPPEELKRRDRIRKDLEEARRKAEADLAALAASDDDRGPSARRRQRRAPPATGSERRAVPARDASPAARRVAAGAAAVSPRRAAAPFPAPGSGPTRGAAPVSRHLRRGPAPVAAGSAVPAAVSGPAPVRSQHRRSPPGTVPADRASRRRHARLARRSLPPRPVPAPKPHAERSRPSSCPRRI